MVATWKSSAWIDVAHDREQMVLRICGELDLESCLAIEPAMIAALDSCPSVMFDLSALTFCDSSGIAMFLSAHQHAVRNGTRMQVCDVPRLVARVFEISGVGQTLNLSD